MSTTELAVVERHALQPNVFEPPYLRLADRPRTDVLDAHARRSVELPLMVVDAVVLLAAAVSTVFAQGHVREVAGLVGFVILSMVLRGAYRPRMRQLALDGMA